RRLFGEQSAVGQTVEGVMGRSLTVVGVLKDLPPTHLGFQSVASIRTLQMVETAREEQRKAAEAQSGPPAPGGPIFMFERPSMSTWQSNYSGGHYLRMAPDADAATFLAAATREIQAAGDQGAKQVSTPPGMPPGMVMSNPTYHYNVVPVLDLHL